VPKLTPIKPKNLIKLLEKQGFLEIRQKGSHKFFRHKDGRTTVVPYHTGREISRGLLKEILDDIEMPVVIFLKSK
jgi:predicted RNA binding protein YcfA (HicA-like mRNA interferase family)